MGCNHGEIIIVTLDHGEIVNIFHKSREQLSLQPRPRINHEHLLQVAITESSLLTPATSTN